MGRCWLSLKAALTAVFIVAPMLASCAGSEAGPPAAQRALAATTTASTSTTTSTSPLVEPVSASLVDDCVEYVQFGAFTGNQMLSSMWDTAGQDVVQLRDNCGALGVSDPGALEALSDGWHELEGFFAAASEAARTTTTPAPAPPPPPPAPVVSSPVQPIFSAPQVPAAGACGEDSYLNVDGVCVHSPVSAPSAPSGATAQCEDGTYSFSQHRSGTCSHHGGVAIWL